MPRVPISSLLFVLCCALVVDAHIRFIYPPPRTNQADKTYPCGDRPFFGNGQPITELQPGVVTLHWEEFINHDGAPFRLAISVGNDDGYDEFVLVDHLPHMDVQGLTQYYYNITIPDINCPECSIQLMNPMTDKITYGTCCSYPTEGGDPYCFSVYHSCANIRILGTQDPATYIANHQNPPGGPYMRESAQWTNINGGYWLIEPYTITYNPQPGDCKGGAAPTDQSASGNSCYQFCDLFLLQYC